MLHVRVDGNRADVAYFGDNSKTSVSPSLFGFGHFVSADPDLDTSAARGGQSQTPSRVTAGSQSQTPSSSQTSSQQGQTFSQDPSLHPACVEFKVFSLKFGSKQRCGDFVTALRHGLQQVMKMYQWLNQGLTADFCFQLVHVDVAKLLGESWA